MKKILCYKILIAMMVLLAILCVYAVCSASQLAGGTYRNLTWTIDNDTGISRLIISGNGKMETVGSDSFPWSNYSSVKKVVIDYGITNVGENAFVFFKKLTDVELPSSVKSIDTGAFQYCESLSSITLPTGVTTIGSFAFSGCTSLSSILNIQNVTSIGGCAFYDCKSLTSFTIPRSVTSIGESVFLGCTGLQTVTVQSLASEINFSSIFSFCSNLVTVIIPEDNPFYCSENGVVFNKDKTTILFCPQGQSGPYEIPYSVTTIGEGAFVRCSQLSDVTIHNNVTSIEDSAFGFCTRLARVKIPDSVTSMGSGVFNECSNLVDVQMPKYLSNIKDLLFNKCSSLESITIPDTVSYIGERAFWGCTSLGTVTIPSSVEHIEASAFESCTGLTDVTIQDGVKNIWRRVFYGCTGLTEITIPASVIMIENQSFYNCTSLVSVVFLPTSSMTLGYSIFEGCPNLVLTVMPDSDGLWYAQSYEIPYRIGGRWGELYWALDENGTLTVSGSGEMNDFDLWDEESAWRPEREDITKVVIQPGITSIGSFAFAQCEMTNVTIPDTVQFIGVTAFYHCEKLTSVTIPDGVAEICSWTFGSCSSLTNITIPDSVLYIFPYAFFATDLEGISLPGTLEGIDECAFASCYALESVTLPATVGYLGYGVFSDCPALTCIYVDAQNKSFASENGVLYDYSKTTLYQYPGGKTDTSFVVPRHTTVILDGAFQGCHRLNSILITDAVNDIGTGAFDGCYDLVLSVFPGSTSESFALQNSVPIKVLNVLILPQGLKKIEAEAFMGLACDAVVIPDGCNAVGSKSFANCKNLIYIYIPSSVTNLANDSFSGSDKAYLDRQR